MTIRCVIVDDSERFRAGARRLLTAQGISVVADAADSQEALRVIHASRPDVVLVDVGLGEESGFDLAARIEVTPVIMVSAFAAEEIADLIADSRAIGFLPKEQVSAAAITCLMTRIRGT
ncbi:response regulator transcription factor [Dactylosporangium sp. NPDC005555]|uniref:response regulator n=1 Tax=Dactylosporangium sp. NPDC005555 TaxID=3154889 RepID=UPI0033AB8CA8